MGKKNASFSTADCFIDLFKSHDGYCLCVSNYVNRTCFQMPFEDFADAIGRFMFETTRFVVKSDLLY